MNRSSYKRSPSCGKHRSKGDKDTGENASGLDAQKEWARQHADVMARLDRIERPLLPPVRKP